MTTPDFYKIVNTELDSILIDLEKGSPLPFKKSEQRKSFAFLVWILNVYGLTNRYNEFITDGSGDSSCDIILNKKNKAGEEIFYVIQSKWNTLTNAVSYIDSKDIKQTLNDFETVLAGNKAPTKNLKFNKKSKELKNHLSKNGRAKFLFVALCNQPKETDDNIASFNLLHSPKITLDVLDVNRLKRDYIETVFKEVVLDNPLDFNYRPEDIPVTIPIERYNDCKRDLIEYYNGKEAYIFLVKPKGIYDLFQKFGFQLFYRNVRNPLPESNYNNQIAKTLINEPGKFWFFNNGITGITQNKVDIGVHANEIVVDNLQIINGAQTVFTIYECYRSASKYSREKMDKLAKITLRLIVSDDAAFNNEITQYTNSQNPLISADFYANDSIQERLQVESYAYNLWYEKRRGEFRHKPDDVSAIDKELLTGIYLACHLEEPVLANNNREMHFTSKKDNPKGLYEYIFNDHTHFVDMLASFKLFKINIISTYSKPGIDYPPDDRTMMPFLTLSKIVLDKCLSERFNSRDLNINSYILKNCDTEEFKELHVMCRAFVATNFFNKYLLDIDRIESQQNFNRFLTDRDFFQEIKRMFKDMTLSFDIVEKYNKEVKPGKIL